MPGTHRVVDHIVAGPAATGIDHIFGVAGGQCSGANRSHRRVRRYFMHGGEAPTAVHCRLAVQIGVFNHNAHTMSVTRERAFYHDTYSYNRFPPRPPGAIWHSPGQCARRSMSTDRPLSASNARQMNPAVRAVPRWAAKSAANQQIPTA